jgi:hypothetical protein
MPTFERRSGPDWVVEILVEDEIIPVTIFDVADEATAIKEALWSFAFHDRSELIVISAVEVDDG